MYRIEILKDGAWFEIHGSSCLGQHLTEAKMVQSSNAIGSLTLDFLPTSMALKSIACNTRVRVSNERTGAYEFYGRVIDVTPQMDEDGKILTEAVCEDALGFLQDTCVWIDSQKTYFDGENKGYWVDIDDDGTRTMRSADLLKLVVGQHNNTVGDSHGDKWKRMTLDDLGVDQEEETSFDAEYEATTYEMLSDIAEDAGFEYRSSYDGTTAYLEAADSLGAARGTFKVGDNLASTALKTSMADVVTRMFPYGDEYAKLEKVVRKGVRVQGALKGSEWQTKKGTMVRFPVTGKLDTVALKCVLTVGARDKDYAMVVFTSDKITSKNADKVVVKKYTTKAKATGANLVRRYPVPEDAKYVYVYGADSKCTTYGYYTNGYGAKIKDKYRTDLAFWKKKLTDKQLKRILDKYGVEMGSVVDGSNDRSYFLRKNEDKYGAVEGTCIKEKQLKTDKITNAKKAVYSIDDLKATKAKAQSFVKFACRQLKKKCRKSVELTVTGYDLAEAGLGYDALRLYDTWTVTNELCGINHKAEVVRIERDLLEPWNVEVEMGSKVTRASSSGRVGSLDGGTPSGDGDDDDSDADEYATLAGQLADAAEEAAGKAVEKADELDDLSYKIQTDSLAAGQLADEAYQDVHPITNAMRSALEDAEEQASQLTAVKESQSQTIQTSNALARAVATYSCETEKSIVRWKQTYTASLDAWASDDKETQAKIKAAYAKLYGEDGTAENPTADSAQGRLNSAKAENVEAVAVEAQMKTELASANAYQTSCSTAAKKAQSDYDSKLKAYKALKKKTSTKKKQIDAAAIALNAALAKRDKSQAAVDAANTRCAEAEQNYAAAKAALAAAEAKVEAAGAEVDTAMNGIHELYSSTIEQTAKGIKLTAEKTEAQEKKLGQLEVTAEGINSDVKTLESKTGALMKATNMKQTDSGWTWSIVDNTARDKADDAASDAADAKSTANSAYSMSYNIINGTGTLTLGGSATAINMGGSTTSITMGPAEISSEYVSELGISVMSISPSNATGYSGLYLHSGGGLRVGSSSDIEGGVVSCGSVMSKGDIWVTSGDVRTSGVYASSRVYAGGALTTSLSSASVATGKAAVGTGTGGSNHGLWSDALGKWMIYSNGSTVTCNSSSSKFVKENISDVPDEEAAKLLGIRTVTYDYKKGNPGDKGWIGVIAEEVYGMIPRAVIQPEEPYEDLAGMIERGEDTSELGIDYGTFTPYLIKLCQMQQRQIDALEKRVSALEGVDSDTSQSCD